MAAIFFSRLLPRDARERRTASGCVALCVLYAGILAALMLSSGRFDRDFLAARAALRDRLALANPLAWGRTVDLSSDAALPRGLELGAGWSAREPNGVWSDGDRANLSIGLPPPDGHAVRLRIVGTAQLDAAGRQTLRVQVGGEEIGHWDVRQPGIDVVVTVPPHLVTDLLRVGLEIGRPVQAGADPRALGLKLRAITVTQAAGVAGPR